MNDLEQSAPEAGEEIHLPGPSLLPFLSAIGITLAVIGTTVSWFISIAGVIILVLTTIRWVRETRRDIESLPEEHH